MEKQRENRRGRSKQNWATRKKNEGIRTDCTIGKVRTNPYQGTNELKLTNKQTINECKKRQECRWVKYVKIKRKQN